MRPRRRPDSRWGRLARFSRRPRTPVRCLLWGVAAFACLLALGAAAPATAKSRLRYVTTKGVRYLYMADIAAAYGMRYEGGTKRFAMRSRYSSLQFVTQEILDEIYGGAPVPKAADEEVRA